ncbi:hypothetical protein NL108_004376 [Boleophthalmus pectinirostris]|uniref:uncharacterized protein DDB_G0283697 n=1 Tax=Boleophthalmus pectinirostris TaxID=150288 RepID=UPI000A1C4551|nr:uncharacterized protein DDB_G0283697 [Boleophthalmus pectinirostris]XP_020775502.1 uncharacterized protein DDB_G0283697 [Boleophthalmus pectinirostris]KAJ0062766.1 hypothetical protein NL108_004376 [Boleophthalmus pectinirostris]
MALRKEVFQAKVLQKLYPAAPAQQRDSSSAPLHTNVLSKKPTVKKIPPGNSSAGSTSTPAKRLYTVLPPPADYKTDAEKSVTHSAPETLKNTEDPAEKSEDESSNETDQGKDPEEKKRRRRRKKRKDHMPPLNQTAVNEGEERMNKNKKRKLKKKRHKEKLLSMGLVPRAAAVEFTYQREGQRPEEGEEDREEGSSQVNQPGQDCRGTP